LSYCYISKETLKYFFNEYKTIVKPKEEDISKQEKWFDDNIYNKEYPLNKEYMYNNDGLYVAIIKKIYESSDMKQKKTLIKQIFKNCITKFKTKLFKLKDSLKEIESPIFRSLDSFSFETIIIEALELGKLNNYTFKIKNEALLEEIKTSKRGYETLLLIFVYLINKKTIYKNLDYISITKSHFGYWLGINDFKDSPKEYYDQEYLDFINKNTIILTESGENLVKEIEISENTLLEIQETKSNQPFLKDDNNKII